MNHQDGVIRLPVAPFLSCAGKRRKQLIAKRLDPFVGCCQAGRPIREQTIQTLPCIRVLALGHPRLGRFDGLSNGRSKRLSRLGLDANNKQTASSRANHDEVVVPLSTRIRVKGRLNLGANAFENQVFERWDAGERRGQFSQA